MVVTTLRESGVRRVDPRWIFLVAAIWLVAITAGLVMVWRYKATPGAPASGPARWPAATAIPRVPGHATLVMIAHPQCPCTKASLDELAVVMSRVRGKVDAWVVFIRPEGVESGWEDTATRRQAAAIDGVAVAIDSDGREAARFGAAISGQVLLYDPAGARLFAGGITGVRGHVGDNIGRQRLLALIESRAADAPTSKVFGCELFGGER